MKPLFKILLPLLAAFGFVLAGGGAAHAGSDGPTLCITGSCNWFVQNGDRVYVQDTAADGHSAVAQVCAPADCSIVANYLWNANGNGTTINYGYGTQIPEGTPVYYRPCIGENGTKTILACNSGWTHGTA